MITLSLNHWLFVMLMFLGPLIITSDVSKRRYVFLFVNIILYILCIKNVLSALGIFIFIFTPYLYIYLRRSVFKLWPIVIIMTMIFIYLNGYLFIIESVFSSKYIVNFQIVGLSYIFFRILYFLVYIKDDIVDNFSFIDYLNYIFSFWTIMAGPIQRYNDFMNSFSSQESIIDFTANLKLLHRVANGFIKVFLFGVLCKEIADTCYAAMIARGFGYKKFFALYYCYPMYVYFNFSGYCDIVIAMAAWAGFKIPENFNKPYLSRNMIEFWNRWHITLSICVRDLIYQPLLKFLMSGVLSNNVLIAQYISVFVTFFIVGIWHGTTTNFVIFGLLQGLGMIISMMYKDGMKKLLGKHKFKNYTQNNKIALVEILVCFHFVFYTFIYIEYDFNYLLLWQLKLLYLQ
ncbi:MAG: hypothetical protein HQL06_04915 [Nitrospirae bacterium]|nr:hypothetical protein [Nitrospirota bacterium]